MKVFTSACPIFNTSNAMLKKGLLGLVLLLALTHCTDFSIPQEKVAGELETYGKQYDEHYVRIKTPLGNIECLLFEDTPLHKANFLRLISKGYYTDKAEFYRVKESFMIQGGDPTRTEPGFLVPAEINLKHFHRRGALAAARRDENPGMASNPSDFYIVTGEGWDATSLAELGITPKDPRYESYLKYGGYPYLDGKYTVFGQVVSGMEVVEKIGAMRTRDMRPLEPVNFELEIY
jgi:cyclophilin family peptidyl-prolyl cis-trans isomerase